MIYGMDLFSGIGGITLALGEWVRPVLYCENERYAQAVLLSRMSTGELPKAPIWDDVRTLRREHVNMPIDIIYGGFPCQDISVAGKGAGLAGERSGLFFEITRLISEIHPTFVFLENVPAIRTRGGERVGKELARLGYDCRWTTLSAAEIGACHKRNRWFLLAYSKRNRRRAVAAGYGLQTASKKLQQKDRETRSNNIETSGSNVTHPAGIGRSARRAESTGFVGSHGITRNGEDAANSYKQRTQISAKRGNTTIEVLRVPCPFGGRSAEPIICRRNHGVYKRVDRIKALGNSVVPLQAREAFKELMGIKEAT